jgi:hypothetical protein
VIRCGAFVALVLLCLVPARAQTPYVSHYLVDCGPRSYTDPASGIVFSVERDGVHLVATGPDGKLLWRRAPHADAHVPKYRTDAPCIADLGGPQEWMTKGKPGHYVGLSFNNSQSGLIDVATGDFIFEGQD